MNGELTCPVCGTRGVDADSSARTDTFIVSCPACSRFSISKTLTEIEWDNWWTPVRRAALSHKIRTGRDIPRFLQTPFALLTSPILQELKQKDISLPSRLEQFDNAIRFLASLENSLGDPPMHLPIGAWAQIGCPSDASLVELIRDMRLGGFLSAKTNFSETKEAPFVYNARLSLLGWQRWETLKGGVTASRNGFIAMQFGDERLDALVSYVIRPAIQKQVNVELVRIDSPGTARAGLIDNVMRDAIESAAFVLVELSHGNLGAYWEAGLAEGLGKPVIYLCEKAVFDDSERRPHFDVNHRTTIMWEEDKPDELIKVLIPTIRTTLRHHYPDNQETLPK